MWAIQATPGPPEPMTCRKNQNPNKNMAGTLMVVTKNKSQTRTSTRFLGYRAR